MATHQDTTQAEASIEIEQVSKSYGRLEALKTTDLYVQSGELFGLIGPDGAGKSTLIRILATLLKPKAGTARVAGYDTVRDYRQIRNLLGYMPGRFSLYQDLSVEENLSFFATVFGTTIAENYELIRDIYVQLEPFRTRRAGNLSGGMKQKLALCCALIHYPRVLLLDEPTTGVDPVSRKEFWDMLARLKARGITMLVSTPYMDEASRCDRVALIQNGTVFSVDTPRNVEQQFSKPLYAVRADRMYPLILTLRSYAHHDTLYPFGEYLHYTDQRGEIDPELLRQHLEAEGHTGVEVRRIAPNIEDTFMELMQSPQTPQA